MRKLWGIVLTAALLAALSGCSGDAGSTKPVADTSASTAQSAESEAQQTTLPETVLYEAEDVKITATGLEESGIFGPEIKLLLENNGGTDLIVQPDHCIVNGYMVNAQMSTNLAAGKKANDGLILMRSELEDCGIDTIAEVQVSFSIIDAASFSTITKTGLIDLPTSAAGTYVQGYDDSGEEVYNADGLRVVAKGIRDGVMGKEVVLYIENGTGQDLIVQADDVSANGFMIFSACSCDVLAGTRAVTDITLLSSSLEENGVEDVETCEFSLRIVNLDSFMTVAESDAITLNF